MEGIGFWTLFLAAFGGVASFLSPCVLPLVPAYLSYAAGGRDRHPLPGLLLFCAGFASVFIAFGMAASGALGVLLAGKLWFERAAGVILVVLGLHLAGLVRIALLDREWRAAGPTPGRERHLGFSYLTGAAFGFGWTPCIGPILGGILTLAAQSGRASTGAILLGVYAAGLAVPFLIAGVAFERFLAASRAVRRHLHTIERIAGALLILTGFLIFFGWFGEIGNALNRLFPFLGQLG